MQVVGPVDRASVQHRAARSQDHAAKGCAFEQALVEAGRKASAASSPTGQCVPTKFATPPSRMASARLLERRQTEEPSRRGTRPSGPQPCPAPPMPAAPGRRTRPASQALKNTSAGRLAMPSRSEPRSTVPLAHTRPLAPGSPASKNPWPAKWSTSYSPDPTSRSTRARPQRRLPPVRRLRLRGAGRRGARSLLPRPPAGPAWDSRPSARTTCRPRHVRGASVQRRAPRSCSAG